MNTQPEQASNGPLAFLLALAPATIAAACLVAAVASASSARASEETEYLAAFGIEEDAPAAEPREWSYERDRGARQTCAHLADQRQRTVAGTTPYEACVYNIVYGSVPHHITNPPTVTHQWPDEPETARPARVWIIAIFTSN